MRFFLFVLLFATFCASGSYGQVPPAEPDSLALFEFNSVDEATWGVVNDGVMGGRSKGYVGVGDGSLQFTGTLVTRGGGFTSVRAYQPMDLSKYDGLALRVRGGGRTFEIEVSDGARFRGRSVSRRAAFETSEEWSVVRLPFRSFRSSIFGQSVNMSPMDPAKVEGLGLYMLDGIDGAFEIEVDAIWAYRDKVK